MNKVFVVLIIALAGLLLATPPADADNYYGVNIYDGAYHYHYPSYDDQGRYYPAGTYAWIGGGWHLRNYGYLYPPSANGSVGYSADWKNRLLDIAAARDKGEIALRKQALDYQNFSQAASVLGLHNNFTYQNYGAHPGFPYGFHPGSGYAGSSLGLGSYGASGNTVYGSKLTYNSVKDVYGDLSPSALYQQAAMLAQQANTNGDKATQSFHGLVSEQGENMHRVAEVLARAQAAERTFKATEPQAQSRTTEKVEVQSSAAEPSRGFVPNMPKASTALWNQSVQRCVACHSGEKRSGGFDVSTYQNMKPEKKAKVWARLLSEDKSKLMPRTTSGQGERLTPEEIKAWVEN